jgi:hypothetical protein
MLRSGFTRRIERIDSSKGGRGDPGAARMASHVRCLHVNSFQLGLDFFSDGVCDVCHPDTLVYPHLLLRCFVNPSLVMRGDHSRERRADFPWVKNPSVEEEESGGANGCWGKREGSSYVGGIHTALGAALSALRTVMGAGTSIFPAAARSRRAGAPTDREIIESCRIAVLREDMHCNLSSKGIVKMPDIVLFAPLLRSLDISKNELAEFPLSLLHLENMHTLKLSCNRISKVAPPPHSSVLWRLTSLSLSSNRIARFEDVDVASVMPSLVNLDMAGNPLSFEGMAGLGSGTSRLTSLGLGGGAMACSEAGRALSRAVSCLSNLVELRLDEHGLGQAPWFDALELMSRGRSGEVKEGEGGHADGEEAKRPLPLKKIIGDEGGHGHGGRSNNVESEAGESEAGEVIGKREKERKAEGEGQGTNVCAEVNAIRDAENVSAHAGGAEDEPGETAHVMDVMAGLAAGCLTPLFNNMAQLTSLDREFRV